MFHYGLVSEGRDFVKKCNFMVFLSKGIVKTYDPFGMTPRFTAYKDFVVPVSAQGAFLPDKIGMTGDPSNQSDFYYMLGKDGRFLTARTIPAFKTPATEGRSLTIALPLLPSPQTISCSGTGVTTASYT